MSHVSQILQVACADLQRKEAGYVYIPLDLVQTQNHLTRTKSFVKYPLDLAHDMLIQFSEVSWITPHST